MHIHIDLAAQPEDARAALPYALASNGELITGSLQALCLLQGHGGNSHAAWYEARLSAYCLAAA